MGTIFRCTYAWGLAIFHIGNVAASHRSHLLCSFPLYLMKHLRELMRTWRDLIHGQRAIAAWKERVRNRPSISTRLIPNYRHNCRACLSRKPVVGLSRRFGKQLKQNTRCPPLNHFLFPLRTFPTLPNKYDKRGLQEELELCEFLDLDECTVFYSG